MPKKLKILLAEDEPSLCRYMVTLLSRWECEIAIEPTAVSAIRRAAVFEPDVALLGYCTPGGVDGAEAGIGLLKVSPGTRIVLFNESVPADILSNLRAQGYEFRTLAAPFDIQELQELCFSPAHPRTE